MARAACTLWDVGRQRCRHAACAEPCRAPGVSGVWTVRRPHPVSPAGAFVCSVLNFTYEEMKADIQGMKDWLVNECGIPAE